MNRFICAHLTINSVINFDFLVNITKNNIDILMISETKLDSSFPDGIFLIHGFSEPYKLDRNSNRGGILLYIREGIPLELIDTKTAVEGLFVKVNLQGKN